MIEGNAIKVPVKMRIEFKFDNVANSNVTINIYGIDKRGHNLISTCLLESTGVSYSSEVFIGMPQDISVFPWICYTYNPSSGFRIIGTPELICEKREFPDLLDTNVYTPATLT
jgi:hypothetical protein